MIECLVGNVYTQDNQLKLGSYNMIDSFLDSPVLFVYQSDSLGYVLVSCVCVCVCACRVLMWYFSQFAKLTPPLVNILRQVYIKKRNFITLAHWDELANTLHRVLVMGVKGTPPELQVM